MTQDGQDPRFAGLKRPPATRPEVATRASRRTERPRRNAGPSAGVVRLAVIAAVVLALLGGGVLVVRAASSGGSAKKASATASKSGARRSGPTAVFAYVSKSRIPVHFPASDAQFIAVGFHQAYNPKAFAFEPTMKMLPIYKPPSVTKGMLAADPSIKLFEQALRYRGSSARSAADCAVRPGSTILSPVTGKVTLLKHYKLEGRIDDLQLEIQPDGAPLLRVVMIHIKDVTVNVGDRVVGGVTPVATVRHLTLDSAVNRYLPVSPADHTHVQVNDERYRLPSS